MNNLRFKLLLSLVIFSLVLVMTMSYLNRQLLVSETQKREEDSRQLIEDHIYADMQSVDNANFFFDSAISRDMELQTRALLDYYSTNQDVLNWDLNKLQDKRRMHIYILDEKNTVIHTTLKHELGLNFSACCEKFSAQLDTLRKSGDFFSGGIDFSSSTGEMRKYSYMGTPDRKYLIELSIDVNDDPILQMFNFRKSTEHLLESYDDLLEMRLINIAGTFANNFSAKERVVSEMPRKFEEAYNQTKRTMEPTEYKEYLENGYIETYRFLPYKVEIKGEAPINRVIFVKYGNKTELALLKENTKQIWLSTLLSLLISLATLLIIMKILTKTIDAATYDSLTKVYNRATYIRKVEELLLKRKNPRIGLLLVDLDNFKQVNDQYGHKMGDSVLVKISGILKEVVGNKGFVSRMGGDEFAIIVYDSDESVIGEVAHNILEVVHKLRKIELDNTIWNILSVSIGGAILQDSDERESSLFIRADKALYRSKNQGKDQYHIWSEGER